VELGKGVYEWAYEQIYTERNIVHVVLKNVLVSGNDGLVTDAHRRVFATFHEEQVPYYANLPPPDHSKSVHRFSKVLYSLPFIQHIGSQILKSTLQIRKSTLHSAF
jgi:hypothetical protein